MRRSRSRATSSSGSRTATVPSASPEVPGQGRRVLEHQGEPAGPERLGELVRRPAGRLTTSPASVEASPMSTGTGMRPAAVLRRQQAGHRRRGEGVGRHAVDGVGGQQHQLAAADRGGGGVEAGGALVGVAAVVEIGHGAAVSPTAGSAPRRAVVNRGRPARSGWSATSVEAAVRRGPAPAARSPCWSACSMPSQPPGRSSRAAVTSSPRTTSRPSGPPHSASGGSWSATSRGTPRAVGHVGRVGDDDVDGAVELAQQRRGRSCRRPSTVDRGVARRGAGGRVVPGPLDRPGVALDGGDPGAGVLVRDRQRDRARARRPGRRRSGAGRPASRSSAQPASSSVSGRGTKTPGPTASSRKPERRAGR